MMCLLCSAMMVCSQKVAHSSAEAVLQLAHQSCCKSHCSPANLQPCCIMKGFLQGLYQVLQTPEQRKHQHPSRVIQAMHLYQSSWEGGYLVPLHMPANNIVAQPLTHKIVHAMHGYEPHSLEHAHTSVAGLYGCLQARVL